MKPSAPSDQPRPPDYGAVIDAAKLRAVQLRRQAIQDFWCVLRRRIRAVLMAGSASS